MTSAERPDESRAVQQMTASPQYAAAIDELVERTGRTPADLRIEADRCLQELSSQIDAKATAVWDRMGRWLTRSYLVDPDAADLPALRELGRDRSLVFLPNHRSYLDPLVLRTALARHGFPPNYVLGGLNLALWPLSELGRRAGLIFIRRSTREDPVYPAALRLYLGYLLGCRANLEWYFEGGRTRTGKLRPPKMGVLKWLVDAYETNQTFDPDADDVLLVPVSIVYDQQHEVSALSKEESGGTKTPESLAWVVRFARAQSRRRGRAHVRFGPTLSLREALQTARERAGSDDASEAVPRVAFEVAHRINAATPITPSALVTFGLLDNDGRAMTLAETLNVLAPLLTYVRNRGLPLTSDVDLGRPEGLRKALRTLVREGVVEEYDGGVEPVYAIARDRDHEAGFYRNTLTHYFITRAIAEVASVQATRSPQRAADGESDVLEVIWEHALALRDLLKYEFFFATKREYDAELRDEAALARPGWDGDPVSAAELTTLVAESDLLIAHRVIGPFLESYRVIADRLATREPAAPVDETALIVESLGVARQRWLQQGLHSPESISKDLMAGAVRLAGNRGLLGPGGEELRTAREEFAAELADVVEAVGLVRTIALARHSGADIATGRRTGR